MPAKETSAQHETGLGGALGARMLLPCMRAVHAHCAYPAAQPCPPSLLRPSQNSLNACHADGHLPPCPAAPSSAEDGMAGIDRSTVYEYVNPELQTEQEISAEEVASAYAVSTAPRRPQSLKVL